MINRSGLFASQSPRSSSIQCSFANPAKGKSSKLVTYLRSRFEINASTSFPRSSHAPSGGCAARLAITWNSGKGGALTNRSFGKTSWHAGRPEQPHNLGAMFGTEAGENWRGALPQVAGRAGHFPLLIEHACVEFDLRADCALVVVERLQGDAHPVVLIAALIL